jgi:hypothetical protein
LKHVIPGKRQVEVVIERQAKTPAGKKEMREPASQVETRPLEEPKHPARVTVEDVEDSEDERDLVPPGKAVRFELPFKDVEPLRDPPTREVLPWQPSESSISNDKTVFKRRTQAPRNMELEDQATEGLLGSIREIMVPVKLGDLMDSNPKIRKALAVGITKSRHLNFVQNTEGHVLAPRVQTFISQRFSEESDESSDEIEDIKEEFCPNIRM